MERCELHTDIMDESMIDGNDMHVGVYVLQVVCPFALVPRLVSSVPSVRVLCTNEQVSVTAVARAHIVVTYVLGSRKWISVDYARYCTLIHSAERRADRHGPHSPRLSSTLKWKSSHESMVV